MLQNATFFVTINHSILNKMIMTAAIRLSDKLIKDAKRFAHIHHRSLPKQIEYWSCIGKIVEENPDLPFKFIEDTLFSLEEIKDGKTEEYLFEKH